MDVLGQTELDPSRTNDLKGVDFFRILENFIRETLESSSPGLTKAQLRRFVLVLEQYLALKMDVQSRPKHDAESDHMKRRKQFLNKLQKQRLIS